MAEISTHKAAMDGVEHVRAATIRPHDVLCDAWGLVIGTVRVTAHPSPMDYDKTTEITLELPGGDRQELSIPSGVRVWRKFGRDRG